MSIAELPAAQSPLSGINLTTLSDRRADIEAKQARITALLQEVECEGLLLLDPENVAWFTSGGSARGILDPHETPAVFFSPEGRWILSSNADSQRMFDEELDGLGFQLKEWPWHSGRGHLLFDLCHNRAFACDHPLRDCKVVGNQIRHLRRRLTAYEQACIRAVGQIVGHALEASCRNMTPGDTEREVAGQLSHRLLHRGVQPLFVTVAADDRLRVYRHCGFTPTPIRNYCVVAVTARKYGLCATASRSICFGPPEDQVRKEHDAACKVSATYIATSWPDAVPKQILTIGRRVYLVSGAEHEWLLSPQGHVTGRAPVELQLMPATEALLHAGWAVTWRANAGAALSCDTFLVADDGPRPVTPADNWPLKKIRIQGAEFVRPDLLIR